MQTHYRAEAVMVEADQINDLADERRAVREARKTKRQRRAEKAMKGKHKRAQARLADQIVVGYGLTDADAVADLQQIASSRGVAVAEDQITVAEVAGTMPRRLVEQIEADE
jgi:hypothetical protein